MPERAASGDRRVVVVGGGATGLAAAFAARASGASVTLIEAHRLGGDCTWTGCVPSKALIAAAGRVHGGRRAGLSGSVDTAAVLAAARAHSREVGRDEDERVLSYKGITVLRGRARFAGERRLDVDGESVTGEIVVLATGARPVVPPVLAGLDVLTSESFFALPRLPGRLAVVGAGAVGLELAQACARLGVAIHVVERCGRAAPQEEPRVGEVLQRALEADGVRFRLGTTLTAARPTDEGFELAFEDRRTLAVDQVLCAVGRSPDTRGLALERAGVRTGTDGRVMVDARLRTSAPDVFAAGDVTGGPHATHRGIAMARAAVAHALDERPVPYDDRLQPRTLYTDPQVAAVGPHAGRGRGGRPGGPVGHGLDAPQRPRPRHRFNGRVRPARGRSGR